MTLVDTLALLRDALRAKDKINARIEALDNQVTPEGGNTEKTRSQLTKQTRLLSSAEGDVIKIQKMLAREIEASRSIVSTAESELQLLEERHKSGEMTDVAHAKQARALEKTAAAARARVEIREKAQRAESASDLNWLASVPAIQRKPDVPQQIGEGDISDARVPDWPGASVPERIQMLWREGKKSHSRRPIIISGIVMGVLALAALGLVIVSNSGPHRTAEDYLGEGEVLVPILVDDMQGVRNLDFSLKYDPELLTAVSVVQDKVGRLSVMQYDIDLDGNLDVSLRDVTGITGTGAIVIVRFRANDTAEAQAALEFALVSAIDVLTLEERPSLGDDGWINTATLEVHPPVLRFP